MATDAATDFKLIVRDAQAQLERRQMYSEAMELVQSLPLADRRMFLGELALLLGAAPEPASGRSDSVSVSNDIASASKAEAASPRRRPAVFVDKAEAFVLARPQGAAVRDVAPAIGQATKSVSRTLAIAADRGRIERREDGLWYPRGAPTAAVPLPPPTPTPTPAATNEFRTPLQMRRASKTYASLAEEVVRAAGRPIETGEIIAGVCLLDPTANQGSVRQTLSDMRKDHVLRVVEVIANRGRYVMQDSPILSKIGPNGGAQARTNGLTAPK